MLEGSPDPVPLATPLVQNRSMCGVISEWLGKDLCWRAPLYPSKKASWAIAPVPSLFSHCESGVCRGRHLDVRVGLADDCEPDKCEKMNLWCGVGAFGGGRGMEKVQLDEAASHSAQCSATLGFRGLVEGVWRMDRESSFRSGVCTLYGFGAGRG